MEQVIEQTNHDDHGHEPTDDVDSFVDFMDWCIVSVIVRNHK